MTSPGSLCSARPWLAAVAALACLVGCSVEALAAAGKAATAGDAKPVAKAKEPELPKVLFFIIEKSTGRQKASPAVMSAIASANWKRRMQSKAYDGIDAKVNLVFNERDLDRRVVKAFVEARVPRKERSKGLPAVFLYCDVSAGEPKKKRDRAKDGDLPRYEVLLKVECEACRVAVKKKRITKKKSWKREFEIEYLTPKVQPADQRPETEIDAVRHAAIQFADEFFLLRAKWMR